MAPKPVEGKPRTKAIGVRVLEEKEKRYRAAARKRRVPFSDFVRAALDQASGAG